jgi:DNA recombination protein RmuC
MAILVAISGISFLAGVGLGFALMWILASARLRAARAELSAEGLARGAAAEELRRVYEARTLELDSVRRAYQVERDAHVSDSVRIRELAARLEEQRETFAVAQQRLSDAFKALSDEALKSNNRAFLDLAQQSFDGLLSDARGDVARRQEAIDGLIRPLGETLHRYQQHLEEMEQRRSTAYGSLEAQLSALQESNQALRREAGQLTTALRAPNVQGRWGEVQLRRVLELAGMTPHCDFSEQSVRDTGEGLQRPDVVVHLPGDRHVVVDAKTPVAAFLDAAAQPTEDTRQRAMKSFAKALRAHMDALARKSYWAQFEQTPEFVVMFVPGEALLAAALGADPSILEDGYAQRVVLASPTTLIALLLGVAQGWRQATLERSAQAISELGRTLHDRVRVLAEHFEHLGRALGQATEQYNRTLASLETKVLGTTRKFRELGAATGDEIVKPRPIEGVPRQPVEADDRPM